MIRVMESESLLSKSLVPGNEGENLQLNPFDSERHLPETKDCGKKSLPSTVIRCKGVLVFTRLVTVAPTKKFVNRFPLLDMTYKHGHSR